MDGPQPRRDAVRGCWVGSADLKRRRPHHLLEVGGIELVLLGLRGLLECPLEATDGVVCPFRMRVIARKQEQVRSGIPDQATDVLAWERREFDGPPNVFGRL